MADNVLLGLKITGALLECAGLGMDLYEKIKARTISHQPSKGIARIPQNENTRC